MCYMDVTKAADLAYGEICAQLDIDGPEEVRVSPSYQSAPGRSTDWLVILTSVGKEQCLAVTPYQPYAIAVAVALSCVLRCRVRVYDENRQRRDRLRSTPEPLDQYESFGPVA
jgi:hypothetical protein